jgi:hypothetical protein
MSLTRRDRIMGTPLRLTTCTRELLHVFYLTNIYKSSLTREERWGVRLVAIGAREFR